MTDGILGAVGNSRASARYLDSANHASCFSGLTWSASCPLHGSRSSCWTASFRRHTTFTCEVNASNPAGQWGLSSTLASGNRSILGNGAQRYLRENGTQEDEDKGPPSPLPDEQVFQPLWKNVCRR